MKYVYEHDSLTDLYKRTMFFTETKKLLESNKNIKWPIRFDVDSFHLLNSFWGEEEGNRFLCFIANGIRKWHHTKYHHVHTGRINADIFCMCIPYNEKLVCRIMDDAKLKLGIQ